MDSNKNSQKSTKKHNKRRWGSTKEAAEYLGVSESTLRKYKERGLICYYKQTRCDRYLFSDLATFLKKFRRINNNLD